MIPQQARKYHEAELGTVLVVFTDCIQLSWSVQSSLESRFYRDLKPSLLFVFIVSVSSLSSSLSLLHKPSIPPISHSAVAVCTEVWYNVNHNMLSALTLGVQMQYVPHSGLLCHCNNAIAIPFVIGVASIDTGMVSHSGKVSVSLETGVARYCNNWSCYKGWEICLGHR